MSPYSSLSSTTMSILSHHSGPYSPQTRLSPRLRFHETYVTAVEAAPSHPLSSIPSTRYYLPTATFHNTNGVTYSTSDTIWEWMGTLFAPVEYLHHENISLLEIERNVTDAETGETKKQWVLYQEAIRCLRLKGWESKGYEEVRIPIFMVFVVEEAPKEDVGTEGLGFKEVSIWWDEKVLLDAIKGKQN
ncbi:hypothetical protein V8E51_014094 [Hyaloscypha variabilis]